jgi:dipeptidyl aminopeptidase/acylaminoacyl peptidase
VPRQGLLALAAAALALVVPPAAGATIAYVAGGSAYVASDEGKGAQSVGPGTDVELAPGAFELAVTTYREGAGGKLFLVDLVTTERTALPFKRVTGFDWLDPTTLVVATTTRGYAYVSLWHTDELRKERIYRHNRECPEPGCDFPALGVVASPDGRHVALYGSAKTALVVIRSDGTRVLALTPTGKSRYQVSDVEWSPDSKTLAVSELETEQGGSRLALVTLRGKRQQLLRSASYSVLYPAWSPDGGQIAHVLLDTKSGLVKLQRWVLAEQRSYALQGWLRLAGADLFWLDGATLLAGVEGGVRRVDSVTGTSQLVVGSDGDFDWQPST